MTAPWQTPSAPLASPNPQNLGNRTTGPSVGNAYGAAALAPPIPPFTPAVMSAVAKQQVVNAIDAFLSLWPYDYSVSNGIVTLETRHHRQGIAADDRPGAPALDAIAVQAPYYEGTVDERYGGQPGWWIDWDRAGTSLEGIQKIFQWHYNLKQAILAI